MTTIRYRMGKAEDAYQIASFLHMASGGISNFLLKDILPHCDIIDLIALGVADKKATISFAKTLVAEKLTTNHGIDSKQLDFRAPGVYTLVQEDASDENNNAENSNAKSIFKDRELIGILNFYPVHEHKISDIIRTFVPEARIAHLAELFSNLVPESIYLHALAVKQDAGYCSIGRGLILKVIESAKLLGVKRLSAHVRCDNDRVLNILLKKKFEIYRKIKLESHPLLPGQNEILLLAYTIR
jgi:ribosomal protein S18 acetylase RimI-like enzyme